MTMLCVKELCVTMLCERVVCDNVVRERVVCERVVCDNVVCDNAVCDNVVDGTKYQSARSCHQVKRLPQKAHVHVTKCAPATQSARPCDQVPRLLRHKLRRQTRPSGPKRATRTVSAYACHAKCTWMAASTTPATQSERSCHQVPRLPRT